MSSKNINLNYLNVIIYKVEKISRLFSHVLSNNAEHFCSVIKRIFIDADYFLFWQNWNQFLENLENGSLKN